MFKRSSGGLLTYACDGCDTSGYAQPGGAGFVKWSATIKGTAAPAPELEPTPQPTVKTKPEGFSLESLR